MPNVCLQCGSTRTYISHHNEKTGDDFVEEVYVCNDCGSHHVARYELVSLNSMTEEEFYAELAAK